MEASVFRIPCVAVKCFLFVFGVFALCGCPQEGTARRIWVLNGGDRPVTGVYTCMDPRGENWGENLIPALVPPDGFKVVEAAIPPGETCWVWPHLDGHGLMAVCVLPGDADIYLVVRRTGDGDYCTQALGSTLSPACARELLE